MQGRAWQPNRARASHAYRTAHSSQPATVEKSMQSKKGAPLQHMALVTRADGATVTHKGNPAKKKTHFLKVKKEKQLTRDTEIKTA